MAKGGYRPGAGSGGARPGAGRKKKPPLEALEDLAAGSKRRAADEKQVASGPEQLPLEYMLAVMRDTEVSAARRDRMAIAAAPFLHPRADTVAEGKKAQRQERAEASASAGTFAVPEAPRSVTH